MGTIDLYAEDFPHGSRAGYEQGCRGSACPFHGDPSTLSCREAWLLRQGDYSLRELPDDQVLARPDRSSSKKSPPAPASRIAPTSTFERSPRPKPAAPVIAPPPEPKWAVRRVWAAFTPAGVMRGPFDDQPAAMAHIAEQIAKENKPRRRYRAWTAEEDARMLELHHTGLSATKIATQLDRATRLIVAKLTAHELTPNSRHVVPAVTGGDPQ